MILPLLAIGALGGLLAGMFGVGGGFIMVPLLMSWAQMDQRAASATTLLAIVPAALVSAVNYGLRGEVDLLAGAILAAGAIAGAPLGALLLRRLSLVWLKWIFIAGLAASALRLVIVAPVRDGEIEHGVWSTLALIALGLIMGVIAGLLGVGGGIVAVPVLISLFGMGDLVAKGTSLVALIPGAISGSIPHLRHRLVRPRDALLIAGPATLTSLAGVQLAFVIPAALAGYLFAGLLAGVIVLMALKRVS